MRVANDRNYLDDVGMSQLLAYHGFMEQHSSVQRVAGSLGKEELDGEMPVAGNFDGLPDLAGLAGYHMSRQAVAANDFFSHVCLCVNGQRDDHHAIRGCLWRSKASLPSVKHHQYSSKWMFPLILA